MELLSNQAEQLILRGIVRDFGRGDLKGDRYVFDQIIHVPRGYLGKTLRLSAALPLIRETDLVVLLDRHPNNAKFAKQVTEYLGLTDAWAFVVRKQQLGGILQFIECDAYVTTREGALLLVACHEHDLVDNDRTVWLPIREGARSPTDTGAACASDFGPH